MLNANLLASVHVATACDETGCGRIVATGSGDEARDDDSESAPASPYAAAKSAAALYFRMFHQTYGLPMVLVRPLLTYGPRQALSKLIPHTITMLLRGEAPALASGRRGCDFVFVADVVSGLCRAGLASDAVGRTIDIGTGVGTTVRDAVNMLVEITGTAVTPSFGALPDRVGEPPHTADLQHTRSILGWEPRWSLREGLLETVSWYREQASAQ